MWPEEKMRRWVTIYADAGWKQGRAKVGFIARGSVPPVWLNGSGQTGCDSSQAAEAVAVLHALRKVGAAFQHPDGLEGFFIRSDNTQVVNGIKDPRRAQGTLDFNRAMAGIFELCREREWTLLAKHVRGHGKEPDRIRRWMNARADRLGNMRGVEVSSSTTRLVLDEETFDALLLVND